MKHQPQGELHTERRRLAQIDRFLTQSDKLLSLEDLKIAFLLPGLTSLAWGMSRRQWIPLAHKISQYRVQAVLPNISRRAGIIDRFLGTGADPSFEIQRQSAVETVIAMLEVLRLHRPWASLPSIGIEGAEGLAEAQRQGRPVVCWCAATVHNGLISKIAFAQMGLSVAYIGREGHGFSPTRFGRTVLNPIVQRVENRFLKERVFINLKAPAGATLKLLRELKRGGTVGVSMASSRHRGASAPVRVPFHNGHLEIAPGAASLAAKSDAALFPIMALREGLRYRVIVGPELTPRRPGIRPLVRDFAEWNAGFAKAHPAQWSGWFSKTPRRAAARPGADQGQ